MKNVSVSIHLLTYITRSISSFKWLSLEIGTSRLCLTSLNRFQELSSSFHSVILIYIGSDVNSFRFESERKEIGEELHRATRSLLSEAFGGQDILTITEKMPVLRQFTVALEMVLKHGLKPSEWCTLMIKYSRSVHFLEVMFIFLIRGRSTTDTMELCRTSRKNTTSRTYLYQSQTTYTSDTLSYFFIL